MSTRTPREGTEVRVPDYQGAPGSIGRILRPEGGNLVSGAPEARGAGLRGEPLGRAGERESPEVLSNHGEGASRVGRGPRVVGTAHRERSEGPGGGAMTSVDAYVEQVRRGHTGLDAGAREDIVREPRGPRGDSVGADGGNVNAAVASLGDPVVVARRYRELYGYGVAYRSVFAIVAGILGGRAAKDK